MEPDQSPHQQRRKWAPLILLIILAFAAGVAWRAELELRGGWYSLTWLWYFHWAIPAGILAFIGWVLWVAKVRRPIIFCLAMLVFAITAYVAVEISMRIRFAGGPHGMLMLYNLGGGDFDKGLSRVQILDWVLPILWALLPIAFFGLCWLFGVRVRVWTALVSAIGFPLSWLAGIYLYAAIEGGESYSLHGLKSGWVIPLLVLCLGLPLLKPSAPKGPSRA